jgi:hypothetical protein
LGKLLLGLLHSRHQISRITAPGLHIERLHKTARRIALVSTSRSKHICQRGKAKILALFWREPGEWIRARRLWRVSSRTSRHAFRVVFWPSRGHGGITTKPE